MGKKKDVPPSFVHSTTSSKRAAAGTKFSARTLRRRRADARAQGQPVPAAPRTPLAKSAPLPRRAASVDVVALLRAADTAKTAASAAVAHLALVRHDDPDVRAELDAGASVAAALLGSSKYAHALLAISRPADLAQIVIEGADGAAALGYEREDDETADEFAAQMRTIATDARARAVALLEQTLAIVRGPDGIPERWRRYFAKP